MTRWLPEKHPLGLHLDLRVDLASLHVRYAERDLASDFSKFLNETGLPKVTDGRGPTPFMSPTTVIASQLNALQRNDYPELDDGAGVVFAFTKPQGCEDMLPGGVGVCASFVSL